MGIDEFFARLPRDGWFLDESVCIRRMDGCGEQCPITSLMPIFDPSEYMEAAKKLRLKRHAGRISRAADFECRDLSPSTSALRRRLLEHCGLTETHPC